LKRFDDINDVRARNQRRDDKNSWTNLSKIGVYELGPIIKRLEVKPGETLQDQQIRQALHDLNIEPDFHGYNPIKKSVQPTRSTNKPTPRQITNKPTSQQTTNKPTSQQTTQNSTNPQISFKTLPPKPGQKFGFIQKQGSYSTEDIQDIEKKFYQRYANFLGFKGKPLPSNVQKIIMDLIEKSTINELIDFLNNPKYNHQNFPNYKVPQAELRRFENKDDVQARNKRRVLKNYPVNLPEVGKYELDPVTEILELKPNQALQDKQIEQALNYLKIKPDDNGWNRSTTKRVPATNIPKETAATNIPKITPIPTSKRTIEIENPPSPFVIKPSSTNSVIEAIGQSTKILLTKLKQAGPTIKKEIETAKAVDTQTGQNEFKITELSNKITESESQLSLLRQQLALSFDGKKDLIRIDTEKLIADLTAQKTYYEELKRLLDRRKLPTSDPTRLTQEAYDAEKTKFENILKDKKTANTADQERNILISEQITTRRQNENNKLLMEQINNNTHAINK
ncbi:hypothetical protein EBU94_06995, partial [bacterium]|nr:hypothetical protein [bacterium]